MIYAVIDIGSNTIRLVIYKVENGKLIPMFNKKVSAGLAGYVSSEGKLKDSGVLACIKALNSFKEILSFVEVKEIFPFATASLRNIKNSDEVLEKIRKQTGLNIKLMSGAEEAMYDFYGILQSVNLSSGLMVDIGGGSTEIVLFENGKTLFSTSLSIGSLNMFKNHVSSIIPTKSEALNIVNDTKKLLDELNIPKNTIQNPEICSVGGTARATLNMLRHRKDVSLDDREYDADLLKDLVSKLQNDDKKIIKQVLKVAPDRIHTFFPGLIILNTIAKYFSSQKVLTSEYGVREGYLHYTLERREELDAR